MYLKVIDEEFFGIDGPFNPEIHLKEDERNLVKIIVSADAVFWKEYFPEYPKGLPDSGPFPVTIETDYRTISNVVKYRRGGSPEWPEFKRQLKEKLSRPEWIGDE